ncbi:NUDIX hydrolase [Luteococcus sanguinis]|uniref:NUDIX hydrolase n=1 Tax=Luteococcus sanguinis TaxID=174038 RepID=A0ABW1X576_9ACTN
MSTEPLHFTEYSTRLAGYALIVRDGQVLLSWYNGMGGSGTPCWSLPGGGIDYDEDLPMGVAREVHEESGYLVAVGRPLTTSTFTGEGPDGRPWKAVRVIFEAQVTGGSLGTLEVGGSTDHAAWLPIDRVANEPAVADIVDLALRAHANLNA